MSFTPASGSADRSFELVRQSLLQDDGLPFAHAMSAEQIQQAFDAEGVSFGDDVGCHANAASKDDGRDRLYDGCHVVGDAVSGVVYGCAAGVSVGGAARGRVLRTLGVEVSSTNTGAYCRARAKVTEGVVRHLAEGVAERCEAAVPDEWRWKGFREVGH